jgi:hypothetical protein
MSVYAGSSWRAPDRGAPGQFSHRLRRQARAGSVVKFVSARECSKTKRGLPEIQVRTDTSVVVFGDKREQVSLSLSLSLSFSLSLSLSQHTRPCPLISRVASALAIARGVTLPLPVSIPVKAAHTSSLRPHAKGRVH